jgi:hypothetical protein
MALIRCSEEQTTMTTSFFPCQLVDFPLKYPGIPLFISMLLKTTLQPLLDRVKDKVPIWKGRFMHRSGRLTLIKTTMLAMPVYTSIIVGLPPWLLKAFQKVMHVFLWTRTDMVQNGKC